MTNPGASLPTLVQRHRISVRAESALITHKALFKRKHIDYGNGFHGEEYIGMDQILMHPDEALRVVQEWMEYLLTFPELAQINVIAAPKRVGGVLGFALCSQLLGQRPPASTLEFVSIVQNSSGAFVINKPYSDHLNVNSRALLVDSVRNTGKTLAEAVQVVLATGARIEMMTTVYDRNNLQAGYEVPSISFEALVEYTDERQIYAVSDCPMCILKQELIKP